MWWGGGRGVGRGGGKGGGRGGGVGGGRGGNVSQHVLCACVLSLTLLSDHTVHAIVLYCPL